MGVPRALGYIYKFTTFYMYIPRKARAIRNEHWVCAHDGALLFYFYLFLPYNGGGGDVLLFCFADFPIIMYYRLNVLVDGEITDWGNLLS